MEATVTLALVELTRARSLLSPYVTVSETPATPTRSSTEAPRSNDLRVVVDDSTDLPRPESLATLVDLLAYARLTRPDLLASRARAAAARAEVTYQRSLAVRQLGVTIGTKRTAGVTSLLAGVSLPIPLFDQNRGEVLRAAGEQTAAEQALVWDERQVSAEVEAAYEAVRLLTAQAIGLRGSFLARAEQSRGIALAAYQEGAVSLLQVLDASRTLADARLTYYRTVFAQRQSLLELRAATGAPLLNDPALTGTRSWIGGASSGDSVSEASAARATSVRETPGRTNLERVALPRPSVPNSSIMARHVRPSGDR